MRFLPITRRPEGGHAGLSCPLGKYQDKLQLCTVQSQEKLKDQRQLVATESIGASNRAEGIVAAASRLKSVVLLNPSQDHRRPALGPRRGVNRKSWLAYAFQEWRSAAIAAHGESRPILRHYTGLATCYATYGCSAGNTRPFVRLSFPDRSSA